MQKYTCPFTTNHIISSRAQDFANAAVLFLFLFCNFFSQTKNQATEIFFGCVTCIIDIFIYLNWLNLYIWVKLGYNNVNAVWLHIRGRSNVTLRKNRQTWFLVSVRGDNNPPVSVTVCSQCGKMPVSSGLNSLERRRDSACFCLNCLQDWANEKDDW